MCTMKNLAKILLCVATMMVMSTSALAAPTIADQPGYNPSTGLTLGAWGPSYGGVYGFVIANPFQINLGLPVGH